MRIINRELSHIPFISYIKNRVSFVKNGAGFASNTLFHGFPCADGHKVKKGMVVE